VSRSFGVVLVILLGCVAQGAWAETRLGSLERANLGELEGASGRGAVVTAAADPSAGAATIVGQGGTFTATNRVADGAFLGAHGIVTSIQNIGNNVTIQNVTSVTVNIR